MLARLRSAHTRRLKAEQQAENARHTEAQIAAELNAAGISIAQIAAALGIQRRDAQTLIDRGRRQA